MKRIRTVRSVAVVTVASALLFTATGCFGASRPSPQDAAASLATAVATGDFSAVPVTASAAQVSDQLEDVLAGLEDQEASASATVDSAEVDGEDPDRATAHLSVAWDLDGADWSYSTDAHLVWGDEAQQWLVDLRPDDVVAGLATGGSVTVTRPPADRGAILDGAGEELMMERDVAVLGLDKSRLAIDDEADDEARAEAVATSAAAVAEVAGVDVEAYVARAEAAGEQAFVPAITLRDNGATEIPTAQMEAIPGGRVLEDTEMLAPTRSFARDVLGTYGAPDAEQIEASDGELTAGVQVGLSGLQADWEDRLGGSPGLAVTITNPPETEDEDAGPSGSASPPPGETVVFSAEPVPGQDVVSTLDRDVQTQAEAVVAASEVPAGLVAIRPSDGQVLAAASGPEGWPVAVSSTYAPGSTFKVVTALALLRTGLSPQDTVQCPDTVTVDGMVVGNYDGYPAASVGQIPFSEAFAESCNTVFVGAHDTVSAADEAEAAAALGLTAEPETGLSSAVLGSVPDDSTGTEHAANLFGQGVVGASPLGMATVAASVAAGHTVRPVFVSDPAVETAPAPETGITEPEAEQLRSLMAGVVQTGTAEMLQDVPGAPVLAKTGTAEFVADGEDLAHTWLVAIHGDLAVALFFNEGLGGGHDNGPVVRDFLTAVEEFLPSEG
ncbi:penicillin-binding transpeptidase domain-containing protein [Microbacterium sp. A93]|uniref:penicillin-binding transpeptidase domain-containing protein n=1 Tax=Microbacterium sp. A93 TaxID=3450716 RepID=UPI003F43FBC7